MCLAIPVVVEKIEAGNAVVDVGGVKRTISLMLTPEARVGNYVLVHAGYAIGVVDEEEAKETLRLLEDMAEFYNEIEVNDEIHR